MGPKNPVSCSNTREPTAKLYRKLFQGIECTHSCQSSPQAAFYETMQMNLSLRPELYPTGLDHMRPSFIGWMSLSGMSGGISFSEMDPSMEEKRMKKATYS